MIYPFYMYSEGPKEEITTIQCARYYEELIEPIRQVFEKHGITLEVRYDSCILTFPKETIRQVLYPIIQTDRYKIMLPDGYVLYENSSVRPGGFSLVRFAYDEFPDWVQEKYGKTEKE
jgi:hypothetical protein